jgi:CxxC-x17-CxxC domain-containing protein
MGYTDKQIECRECGASFAFTASEQEFYASKGYTNDPKRCPSCRQTRKTQRQGEGGYSGGTRQMYPAVCAQCGKDTEVPFEPKSERPVYCGECYTKVRQSNRF